MRVYKTVVYVSGFQKPHRWTDPRLNLRVSDSNAVSAYFDDDDRTVATVGLISISTTHK